MGAFGPPRRPLPRQHLGQRRGGSGGREGGGGEVGEPESNRSQSVSTATRSHSGCQFQDLGQLRSHTDFSTSDSGFPKVGAGWGGGGVKITQN